MFKKMISLVARFNPERVAQRQLVSELINSHPDLHEIMASRDVLAEVGNNLRVLLAVLSTYGADDIAYFGLARLVAQIQADGPLDKLVPVWTFSNKNQQFEVTRGHYVIIESDAINRTLINDQRVNDAFNAIKIGNKYWTVVQPTEDSTISFLWPQNGDFDHPRQENAAYRLKLIDVPSCVSKLGLLADENSTQFRYFDPQAREVAVLVYDEHGLPTPHALTRDPSGLWSYKQNASLLGRSYMFEVDGQVKVDPMAVSFDPREDMPLVAKTDYPGQKAEMPNPEQTAFKAWLKQTLFPALPPETVSALWESPDRSFYDLAYKDFVSFLVVLTKYEAADIRHFGLQALMKQVTDADKKVIENWDWNKDKNTTRKLCPDRFFLMDNDIPGTAEVNEKFFKSVKLGDRYLTVIPTSQLPVGTPKQFHIHWDRGDVETPATLELKALNSPASYSEAYGYKRDLPRALYDERTHKMIFRYWAPNPRITNVDVEFYKYESGMFVLKRVDALEKDEKGQWTIKDASNLKGYFYRFKETSDKPRYVADAKSPFRIGDYSAIIDPNDPTAATGFATVYRLEQRKFIIENVISKLPDKQVQTALMSIDFLGQSHESIQAFLAMITKHTSFEIINAIKKYKSIDSLMQPLLKERKLDHWVPVWERPQSADTPFIYGEGQWVLFKLPRAGYVELDQLFGGEVDKSASTSAHFHTFKFGDDQYAIVDPESIEGQSYGILLHYPDSRAEDANTYKIQNTVDPHYPFYQLKSAQGAVYSPEGIKFRFWAPNVTNPHVVLYGYDQANHDYTEIERTPMGKGRSLGWTTVLQGQNFDGYAYSFQYKSGGQWHTVRDNNALFQSIDPTKSLIVNADNVDSIPAAHIYHLERIDGFNREIKSLLNQYDHLGDRLSGVNYYSLTGGNFDLLMTMIARYGVNHITPENIAALFDASRHLPVSSAFAEWSFSDKNHEIIPGMGLKLITDAPCNVALIEGDQEKFRSHSIKIADKFVTYLLPEVVRHASNFRIRWNAEGPQETFPINKLHPETMSPEELDRYFYYDGNDLGPSYSKPQTTIKLWLPRSSEANVRLYTQVSDGVFEPLGDAHAMHREGKGTWALTLNGDMKNLFYRVEHKIGDRVLQARDNYAKAVSVGGQYSAIIDLHNNPPGWDSDQRPALANQTDLQVYEINLYDALYKARVPSDISFAGMTETMPHIGKSVVEYIASIGKNAVQLHPTVKLENPRVDEVNPENFYFWGYDGTVSFALNPAYAVNPYDPGSAMYGYKQMIMDMHSKGLRVIQDIQHNHGYVQPGPVKEIDSLEQVLSRLVPNYYYILDQQGNMLDGSGCGNQTDSRHLMVRKLMKDILRFYVEELHVDGFRFDLMGLHDIETINEIRKMLDEIDPSLSLYGEGWNMGHMPEQIRAHKYHSENLPRVGHFNDDAVNSLIGNTNHRYEYGILMGNRPQGWEYNIFRLASGAIKFNDQLRGYDQPFQTVNFPEIHDGYRVVHKIATWMDESWRHSDHDGAAEKSMPKFETTLQMMKMLYSIFGTSQGIAAVHGGFELGSNANPYRDSWDKGGRINGLEYNETFPRAQFYPLYNYFKNVNFLRAAHPAFHMPTADLIRDNLVFLNTSQGSDVVSFIITNHGGVSDEWKNILTVHNFAWQERYTEVPNGTYHVVLDGSDTEGIQTKYTVAVTDGKIRVPGLSTLLAYSDDELDVRSHSRFPR